MQGHRCTFCKFCTKISRFIMSHSFLINGSPTDLINDIVMDMAGIEVEPTNTTNQLTKMHIEREMCGIIEARRILEESTQNIGIEFYKLQELKESQNQAILAEQPVDVLLAQINETQMDFWRLANSMSGNSHQMRTAAVSVLGNWSMLKTDLDKELNSFTRQQRLLANGRLINNSIKGSQQLAMFLMQTVWKLRQCLSTANNIYNRHSNFFATDRVQNPAPSLFDLITEVTFRIQLLVQDTFIVMHQPCQIVKTNTLFYLPDGTHTTEVRLLVGNILGLQLTPPSVSVKMINQHVYQDVQINGLGSKALQQDASTWRLTPSQSAMKSCQTEDVFKATFPKLCVRNFNRSGKNQDGLVMEEKFYLLFVSEFHVGNEIFKIWTASLPIVIITHGSQDCLAWGVVTWHNEFFNEGQVQQRVSWSELKEMLNQKFASITGDSLKEDNLEHLENALRQLSTFPDSLSWADICRNNLPDRGFTFWQWFFEIADSIQKHLKHAWVNGHIVGFKGKVECENFLRNKVFPPGTFLIRFSDSALGAISIVWLHSNEEVYSGEPFEIKSLLNQPFAEKLSQDGLYYVYPNIPKEVAFKPYFDEYNKAKSNRPANKSGYVPLDNRPTVTDPSIPRFTPTVVALDSTHATSEFSLEGQQRYSAATREQTINFNLQEMEQIFKSVEKDLSDEMQDMIMRRLFQGPTVNICNGELENNVAMNF